MRTMYLACLCAMLSCTLPAARSAAQDSPASPAPAARPAAAAQDIPRPDQLEPGVVTTPTTAPTPAAAPAGAGQPGAGAATVPVGAGKSASGAVKPAAAARKGPDRLELDTTDITGNRELPKVLYIVPWKHADLGDLAGRPPNSLLDEVLQPLDRDVFQRENRYYEALKPGQAASKTDAPQGSGAKP